MRGNSPRFRGRACLLGSGTCNFPVAVGSGAAATCERCVLSEVTRKADHSPHSRLVWDLLMPPATPGQFGMCASNWRSQNSALQNRVGRPPWPSPHGRGFPIPPPPPSLPRGSAPTELLTVRSVNPSLLSWLERTPRLSEAASQCRIPACERSEGPLY